jgi:hypothetical protein
MILILLQGALFFVQVKCEFVSKHVTLNSMAIS